MADGPGISIEGTIFSCCSSNHSDLCPVRFPDECRPYILSACILSAYRQIRNWLHLVNTLSIKFYPTVVMLLPCASKDIVSKSHITTININRLTNIILVYDRNIPTVG